VAINKTLNKAVADSKFHAQRTICWHCM